MDDLVRDPLESIDLAPRCLPLVEVGREFVGSGCECVEKLLRLGLCGEIFLKRCARFVSLRGGDREALSELFESYRPRLAVLVHYRLTPEQRRVHDGIVNGPRGRIQGPLRAALHNPELAERWSALGALLRYGTGLSRRQATIPTSYAFELQTRFGAITTPPTGTTTTPDLPDLPVTDRRVLSNEPFTVGSVSSPLKWRFIAGRVTGTDATDGVSSHVTFTSDGRRPAAGDWAGVTLTSTGAAVINGADLAYGREPLVVAGAATAARSATEHCRGSGWTTRAR